MTGTILVTGGAGFIGSHLVDALLSAGRTVVVADDLSTGRPELLAGGQLEQVDIVDAAALDAVVDREPPEVVFHLAAKASVTGSVADPVRDCAVNVLGTLNVLRAAARHGAPVVFTSTGGALYGNEVDLPTPETAQPEPLSPYGASKLAGEAYVRTWAQAMDAPHAVCRLGNVYGPRQTPHGEAGVVAIVSQALYRGEAPVLYGHGSPTRDYIHVDDVVAALLAVSGRRGTFNVGTGVATPVSEVFSLLRQAAGSAVEPRLAPLRTGELRRSCLDASRAARELGWTATVRLDEGIRRTYDALAREFTKARHDG